MIIYYILRYKDKVIYIIQIKKLIGFSDINLSELPSDNHDANY